MTELQDVAAIIHHLLRTLEIGIKGALLADAVSSVVVAMVEERCVSIELPGFAFELNDIVLEVEGMCFAP